MLAVSSHLSAWANVGTIGGVCVVVVGILWRLLKREIADVLGIEKSSVGTTLSRARRRLAEAYEALQSERRERGRHAAS